jgi:uncharacterized membrane protein YphA (DoxX/SURF4 family)
MNLSFTRFFRCLILVFTLVFYFATNNFAQTYIFIGDGLWSDANNWEGNSKPPTPLTGGTIIINGF